MSTLKKIGILICVVAVFIISVWVAIGATIFHFVSKYW